MSVILVDVIEHLTHKISFIVTPTLKGWPAKAKRAYSKFTREECQNQKSIFSDYVGPLVYLF